MKLKRVLVVVLTTANAFAYGQSYSISPNDSLIVTAPVGRLNHFIIQQNNLTTGSLIFSWKQIALNIPVSWEANLCDNGHCYSGFPTSGTMDTIFAGNYGLMSIAVNPDTVIGIAFIQYAVWEKSTPNKIDTLTWIISSAKSTNIMDIANNETIRIFPNPTSNYININTPFTNGFTYIITDENGKRIAEGNSTLNTLNISTINFENAIYFITLLNSDHYKNTFKIIITH